MVWKGWTRPGSAWARVHREQGVNALVLYFCTSDTEYYSHFPLELEKGNPKSIKENFP